MKILLVEDDAELCSVIQKALEKEKYIVDCVSDGETAMFYALNTEYAYDLAIIDRMLPVIDGLTIIKVMRKKGIRIPVNECLQLCRRDDVAYAIRNYFFTAGQLPAKWRQ